MVNVFLHYFAANITLQDFVGLFLYFKVFNHDLKYNQNDRPSFRIGIMSMIMLWVVIDKYCEGFKIVFIIFGWKI